MELRQLRYFAAVARTGSYRAAGTDQHVAQPALWQQVRALEREIGVALFERQGRNVRLTSAGKILLARAQQVLDEGARFTRLADDLRAGRAGRITIATPAPPVQRALAAVVGRFRAESPDVRVVIAESSIADDPRTGRAPSSIEDLRDGRADFAVARETPGLPGRLLYRVHVVAVGAGAQRTMRVGALRDRRLLVTPAGYLSRVLLEPACRAAGFEPAIELESPTPSMLVALAELGQGVAIVSDDGLADDTPRRKVIGLDGAALSSEVWIHWRPDPADPAVLRFIDCLP